MSDIDEDPGWEDRRATLAPDEARVQARDREARAVRLQGYTTRMTVVSEGRAKAAEYAHTYWRSALVLTFKAGDLTRVELQVGLQLIEGGWAGSLDELLLVVRGLSND